jgi:hypothetical protein
MLLGGPACAWGWFHLELLAFVVFTIAAVAVSVFLALLIVWIPVITAEVVLASFTRKSE